MIYKEEHRDLFSVPQGYYLAHCISADLSLGAGIAKQFCEVFNMKEKLKNDLGKTAVDYFKEDNGFCWLIGNVLNLVTKEKYFQNPTYRTLENALEDMKDIAQDNLITKIAMPRIGCGLDKLEWDKVKEIIKNVFGETNIEILVCIL